MEGKGLYVLHFTFCVLSILLCLAHARLSLAQSQADTIELLMMKGDLYRLFWKTNLEACIEWCQKVAEREPKQPTALAYYHGIYAFQHGDLKTAEPKFKEYIDNAPKSHALHLELARLWLAACAAPQNLPEEPKTALSDPDTLRWQSERNYLLTQLGQGTDGQYEKIYQDASKQNRSDLDIFRKHLACIYLSQVRMDDAKRLYDEINYASPEYEEIYQKHETRNGEQIPISIQFYEPIILNHLAHYFYLRAKAACLSDNIANQPDVLYLRSLLNLRLHPEQINQTIEYLQKAYQRADSNVQRSLILTQLGVCDYLAQKTEDATKKWEEAIATKEPTVLRTLAMAYLDLDIKPDEAIQLLLQAKRLFEKLSGEDPLTLFDMSSDYRQYSWDLAWGHFKNKQHRQALQILNREIYPPFQRGLLNEPGDHPPEKIDYFNVRRHLNLARLGWIYFRLTRYDDMYFHIYRKDAMLPKAGYYPGSIQIYYVAKQLDLYKVMGPPDLVVSNEKVGDVTQPKQPPSQTQSQVPTPKRKSLLGVMITGIVVVVLGGIVGLFLLFRRRQRRKL